ncbi:ankyrin repeat protein, partial [Byssothecium circinans]
VQSTLEALSRGSKALDKAYDDAVKRIKGQLPEDRALATNILSWITYAQRPLSTKEICHALAVKLDEKELDLDNILDVEDIISVSAGLVMVDEESDIIRLVHHTTQEYFQRTWTSWFPNAQSYITEICVTYILFDAFKTGYCRTDEEFEARLRSHILYGYAA